MANYKVYIESTNIPLTQVKPLGKIIFSYKRRNNDITYKQALKGDLLFMGDDYTLIKQLSNSVCEEVTISFFRTCNGSDSIFWRGQFTFLDCSYDTAKCTISVSPKQKIIENLFKETIDEKVNFFSQIPVIPKVTGIVGIYETVEINSANLTNAPSDCISDASINVSDWCCKKIDLFYIPDGNNITIDARSYWVRILVKNQCFNGVPKVPYGTNLFSLVQDNCSSNGTADWKRCPNNTYSVTPSLRNGRKLKELMIYLFSRLGVTIISDFFRINEDNTAPNNIAYDYANNYLQTLVFHQKSDVKRPSDSDAAIYLAFEISLKDLLDDLKTMFNIRWVFDENSTVRIEHLSYFEGTSIAHDWSNYPQPLSFTIEKSDYVKKETFNWMDEVATNEFFPHPITYTCGEETVDYKVKNFSADLSFIYANNNPEVVTDKGYLLVSCYENLGEYIVIEENIPMGWQNLHENLHLHGRYQPIGYINNENTPTAFLSYKRIRKQGAFTVPLCCDVNFNPMLLVQGADGTAEIESAEYDILNDSLTVELLY